mmetsp:Transcript_62098/g.178674  ORF Transcript_62098/g.178674 Transcript_62098/m.178674 type:complete len:109 (-) Transcript_62098:239-565(-)
MAAAASQRELHMRSCLGARSSCPDCGCSLGFFSFYGFGIAARRHRSLCPNAPHSPRPPPSAPPELEERAAAAAPTLLWRQRPSVGTWCSQLPGRKPVAGGVGAAAAHL